MSGAAQVAQLADLLQHFARERGFGAAVVGVSGGVDSALVAAIAVRALGAEQVFALQMPCAGRSSAGRLAAAAEVCDWLGLEHKQIEMSNLLARAADDLELPEEPALLRGNLLARLRMCALYAEAARRDALVLGTGNRTELALGYCTKYGDGACDVEVIGRLYKTEVFAAARAVGVPAAVLEHPPSAELFPGHTDEDELGASYSALDAALQVLESGKAPTTELEKRVHIMVKSSAHKRQAPPLL